MNTVTKAEFKHALKVGKVLIVGTNHTADQWNHFRVVITYPQARGRIAYQPVNVETCSKWDPKTHDYKDKSEGMDRRLGVILSIGHSLGLEFSEINQGGYSWIQ